jgi:hypothetical protein
VVTLLQLDQATNLPELISAINSTEEEIPRDKLQVILSHVGNLPEFNEPLLQEIAAQVLAQGTWILSHVTDETISASDAESRRGLLLKCIHLY